MINCNCGQKKSYHRSAHDDLCPIYLEWRMELALELVSDMSKDVEESVDGFCESLEELLDSLDKLIIQCGAVNKPNPKGEQ